MTQNMIKLQNPVTCVKIVYPFSLPIGTNALLDIKIEEISHTLAVLKCELACFSPKLECVLYNITSKNTDVTSMVLITSDITGAVSSYNYPTQLIAFTNLTSGTTYNYCVVAVNMTDMMEVGDPECGNFSTKMTSATDGMNKLALITVYYIPLYVLIWLDIYWL